MATVTALRTPADMTRVMVLMQAATTSDRTDTVVEVLGTQEGPVALAATADSTQSSRSNRLSRHSHLQNVGAIDQSVNANSPRPHDHDHGMEPPIGDIRASERMGTETVHGHQIAVVEI
jgi:hypothetical protein